MSWRAQFRRWLGLARGVDPAAVRRRARLEQEQSADARRLTLVENPGKRERIRQRMARRAEQMEV